MEDKPESNGSDKPKDDPIQDDGVGQMTPEERAKEAMEQIESVLKNLDCSQILQVIVPGSARQIEDGGYVISVPQYDLRIVANTSNGGQR